MKKSTPYKKLLKLADKYDVSSKGSTLDIALRLIECIFTLATQANKDFDYESMEVYFKDFRIIERIAEIHFSVNKGNKKATRSELEI